MPTQPIRQEARRPRRLPAPVLPLLLASLLAPAGCRGAGGGNGDEQETIARALHQANARVQPAVGRRVAYDTAERELSIVFTTPSNFRIDYGTFWLRWRRNQAAALEVFDAAGIPVEVVVAETNHTDGSGRVRARTPADAVRAQGRAAGDAAWRRASEVHQQVAGSAEWVLVE